MTKRPPAPVQPGFSKGLRSYLYLTAATTGAAIMVVEILGAKMLSPFVGTSHFVWTAQIAVTLVALACGYYVGGRLSDRSQKLIWIYRAILGAAFYLVLTVLICEPVAYRCLDFNLAIGSLLASAFLFFVPLSLLAMTAPFLIRVLTSSVAGVGGNVGRLTSVGTLGSFIGTLLISYVMLPRLANSTSMCLTASALALISIGYFGLFLRRPTAAAVLLLLFGAGIGSLLVRGESGHFVLLIERFRGNSPFGQIQVLDRSDGQVRIYSNDNLIQNTYDPVRKQSTSTFTYLLSGLARAYTTNIQDVLCIGMGVGIVPMEFAGRGARVDVVEINPAIIPVAVKYFDLEPERLHIAIDDGRHFLNRATNRYDAVILDAFLGDSSPSHLMTREAFESIARVLRPGGALVINAFCHVEPGRNFFSASLNKTLHAVFAEVRMHQGNTQIFFVATDRPLPSFVRTPDPAAVHPDIREETESAFATIVNTSPDEGRVLTDDYNPVEFYDARNREETRRALAIIARRW